MLFEYYDKIIDLNSCSDYALFGEEISSIGKEISFVSLENYGLEITKLARKNLFASTKRLLKEFPNLFNGLTNPNGTETN